MVILFVLLSFINSSFASQCDELLVGRDENNSSSVTNLLAEQISQAVSENLLAIEDLETMLKDANEHGRVFNPVSESSSVTSTPLLVLYEGIESKLNDSRFSIDEFKVWLSHKVEVVRSLSRDQSAVEAITQSVWQPIRFHKISSGSYRRVYIDGSIVTHATVNVKKDFYYMETLVTRRHWAWIMEEELAVDRSLGRSNNDLSAYGVEEIHRSNHFRPFTLAAPDAPAIVTTSKAFEFLDRINELAKTNDSVLSRIIEDHRVGDQYRFASEDEWEFVASERGRFRPSSMFYHHPEFLDSIAWISESNTASIPVVSVRMKAPQVVDGNPFYDLFGLVAELVIAGDSPADKNGNVKTEVIARQNMVEHSHPLSFRAIGGSIQSDLEDFKRVGTLPSRPFGRDDQGIRKRGVRLVRIRHR